MPDTSTVSPACVPPEGRWALVLPFTHPAPASRVGGAGTLRVVRPASSHSLPPAAPRHSLHQPATHLRFIAGSFPNNAVTPRPSRRSVWQGGLASAQPEHRHEVRAQFKTLVRPVRMDIPRRRQDRAAEARGQPAAPCGDRVVLGLVQRLGIRDADLDSLERRIAVRMQPATSSDVTPRAPRPISGSPV